jgi:predicted AAA-ATPase/PD-(D/E)XK nuclease superfamily protein
MALKKLPVNISHFKTMIDENYIYVDKTRIIYNILEREKFLFLSRPRRFGKSLLVSTFAELFRGNRELFKDLWIGKQSDYDWQQYSVIQLDFSSLAVRNEIQFQESLSRVLEKIGKQYDIDLSQEPALITSKILHLIEELRKKNKVAILIDEYDAPLLANIDNEEIAEKIRDLMKDFFSTIKSCTAQGQIHAIFVTGVTKFSKTSLFSGFNNLSDISMTSPAAALLGYTQDELHHYFTEHVQEFAQKEGVTSTSIFESLREWYNGYRFSKDETKVYGPYSIIFAFLRHEFSNFWLRSGTPTFLIKLLQTQYYEIENISQIEFTENSLDVFDIGTLPLIPILFQAGYLTISGYDTKTKAYTLAHPNAEVREAFKWYILSALSSMDAIHSEFSIQQLRNALTINKIELFCQTLKSMLAGIPFNLHIKAEAYYHSLMHVIVQLLGFTPNSQVLTNKGIIDMVIDTKKTLYVFELKFKDSAQKAMAQIEERKYYEKYKHLKKPITLVGLSFDLKEKELIIESIKEDIGSL